MLPQLCYNQLNNQGGAFMDFKDKIREIMDGLIGDNEKDLE